MADEECPHGLDPSWCSFCKARAAPKPVRSTGRAPRANPVARRPPPAPAAPLGPVRALAKLHKVVFHASAYGSWPAIEESGLRTTAQLLAADDGRRRALRTANVEVVDAAGHHITIRDQRHMVRSGIEAHLDGIDLSEWLDIVNERVFFFTRQKELTTMLARYQESEGQDVVVVDTAKLLAAAAGRVEVADVASGEPVPWTRCACRGRATFVPIGRYQGGVADIEELTVVGGLEPIAPLVVRVVRYHPDHTAEVLVA